MGARWYLLAATAVAIVWAAPGCGGGEDPIRIGVQSDCEELFAGLWDPSLAATELPLLGRGAELAGERPEDGLDGAEVAGRPVELVFGCDDTNLPNTLAEARRLVEKEQVDILIGPLLGVPGLILRDYARLHPEVAFVSTADAQRITLGIGPPNVFRFSADAPQILAGLGAYAFEELGWRRVVTVAGDDSFGWELVAGFTAEFCSLGGEIADRIWAPGFAPDLARLVDELPDPQTYDGIVFPGGPFASASFVEALAGREPELQQRLVLSGLLAGDPAFLEQLGPRLEGVAATWPVPLDSAGPAWDDYMRRFGDAFPEIPHGSWVDVAYYTAMEATLSALERADGDISDGGRRFMRALGELELDSPVGRIRLDDNRQYVGPVFLSRIGVEDGTPHARTVGLVENVEQTFGGYFTAASPPASPTEPECRPDGRPAWAS
jgi:branched-chain amino acid transport system substrate-binding protein